MEGEGGGVMMHADEKATTDVPKKCCTYSLGEGGAGRLNER